MEVRISEGRGIRRKERNGKYVSTIVTLEQSRALRKDMRG